MTNYHISIDKQTGKWTIQKEGSTKTSGSFKTVKEAEKKASELASISGGEVVIHDLEGKIRDSDTVDPGNDPGSIKDTKH
jgi:hypothetical protein